MKEFLKNNGMLILIFVVVIGLLIIADLIFKN